MSLSLPSPSSTSWRAGSVALVALLAATACQPSESSQPQTDPPDSGVATPDMPANMPDMKGSDPGTPDLPTLRDMSPQPDLPVAVEDMSPDMLPPVDMPPSGALTFYEHISPIMQARCSTCHADGGIAPFPLKTYADVSPFGQLIVASTSTKRMPPWPPAEDCQKFRHERNMSAEEISTISQWVSEGMVEGDPAREVILPPDPGVQLGAPDVSFDIGTDYKPSPPQGKFDDYRCFVIDPQLTSEKYVNASQIHPGNAAIVHHVLYYAVPASERAHLDSMAAAEPNAPGYTCFGGPRSQADPTLLGGWVPGATPIKLDPDHGIPVKPGDLIVVQVHYNTANDEVGSDRTRVDLHFAQNNTTAMAVLPLADPRLDIQPGDGQAVEENSLQLPNNIGVRLLKIYGVAPHMHQLGKSLKVTVERNGQDVCLVDIPDWDFNWQGFYLYDTPFQLQPNDKLKIRCVYDNSMAHNEQLGRQPRRVTWGEGTEDEMCLNYVIVNNPGFF